MPIDFLTIKEFCNFITLMIGLKMFKIAYFGLQSIEIFTGCNFPCCNCHYSVWNRLMEKPDYAYTAG